MKNKKNLGLIGLLVIALFGCNKGDISSSNSFNQNSNSSSTSLNNNSSTSTNENQIYLEVQIFIERVELLANETLSLAHKSQIDGTYFIYNTLTYEMKALDEVIAAKATLDQIKEEFLVIYEEYLNLKEAEETGYAFKELVDSLGDADSLLREDKKDIDKLLKIYDDFTDATKALSVVIEAKEKLDQLNSRVNELINMSDDEYEVILFISMVNKLPTVDELTIYDIEIVKEVLDVYDALSDDSKNMEDVLNAKTKLDAYSQRMEELLIIKEHTDAFIDIVSALPTFSELKWNNAEQAASISQAEQFYDSLTEEEKQITSVISAYSELQAIKETFYNLKEPYDITKISFAISLEHPSGSINRKGTFTYTSGKDHITVLTRDYGIPRDELSKYVTVYLNMYIEGGAVPSQPLYSFDITEDYSGYDMEKYVEVLKQLRAEGNDKVQSGIGYTFSVNIVSLNEQYASSDYSGFVGGQAISF